MDLSVRPARLEEATALGDLALRSKAVWGYDAAFLEACRAELTLAPDRIRRDLVLVAETPTTGDGGVVGFVAVTPSAPHGTLDMLFVEPAHLRHGVGALLLSTAADRARERGVRDLVLDADPGAEAFYLAAGARRVGESPSGSVPGRVLPRLRLDLGAR